MWIHLVLSVSLSSQQLRAVAGNLHKRISQSKNSPQQGADCLILAPVTLGTQTKVNSIEYGSIIGFEQFYGLVLVMTTEFT